ncbi:MAG: bifunctional oligoribonuclease/PAP phosphatase NrnA [bacterium]
MKHFFTKLDNFINQSQNIVLSAHERPDGDALGALLGLSYHLEERGKQVVCFVNDPPPAYFNFLDTQKIINDKEIISNLNYDLVIFLDIGDVKRSYLSSLLSNNANKPIVLSIDHHPTILEYRGNKIVHEYLINPEASSTSEIIYHFLKHINAPISRPMATSLLTGILTDTGGFSNLATTTSSIDAAAKLLGQGALLQEITDRTLKNKTLPILKVWGVALSRLQKDPKTGIVSTAIFLKDLEDCGADLGAIDGIANFLNYLQDATAALLLKELPDGLINGSYRTTTPGVDVSEMAAQFGGGGHAKSAGFTVPGRIEQTPSGWQVVSA